MTRLVEVGAAKIRARLPWNKTGIRLVSGERYSLTATGKWVDFFICHGPAGDPSTFQYLRRFEASRRMPAENWFALIGALDCDQRTAFLIGEANEITMARSGELTCYANDLPSMYWNNWGHVNLQVKRSSSD
jgi:hypothetical protein